MSARPRRRADVLTLDYPDGHTSRLRAGQTGAVMPDGHRHTLTALELRALACTLVAEGHARVVGPGHLAATLPRVELLEAVARRAAESVP